MAATDESTKIPTMTPDVPFDIQGLIHQEVEKACKEREDRMWKIGQDAIAEIHRENKEKEEILCEKIATLQKGMLKISNEQGNINAMLLELGNRVDHFFLDKGSHPGDSDSTESAAAIKSSGSSDQHHDDAAQAHPSLYSDPMGPMKVPFPERYGVDPEASQTQARGPGICAPPGLSLDEEESADTTRFHEQSTNKWMDDVEKEPKKPFISLDETVTPSAPQVVASEAKAWEEWMGGAPMKEPRMTWTTADTQLWKTQEHLSWGTQSASHAGDANGWNGMGRPDLHRSDYSTIRRGPSALDAYPDVPRVDPVRAHQLNATAPHTAHHPVNGQVSPQAADGAGQVQWRPITITMVKSNDANSLGTDVNDQPDGTLSVETILPNGMIWKYNESQEQIHGEKVCIGDRICVVNGKTEPTAMLQECKSCVKLDLVVLHKTVVSVKRATTGVLRVDALPFEPRK